MNTTQRIAHNTLSQLAGKALSTALAVITVALMARYLGALQFGWYTTTVTYLQIIGTLVDFGLVLVTTQMMSEKNAQEERLVRNILGLRLVSSVFFFGLASAAVWLFPYPYEVKVATSLTSLSFLFISTNQVFTGVLQRHMAMWWSTVAENINRVIMLVALWLVIANDAGFLWVMGTLVLGGCAQSLVLLFTSGRYTKLGLAFEWLIWKTVIGRAWPIAISIVLNLVYLRGDIFVLSLVRTQSEVGLYGAAFRVIDVINTIPFLIMGVMLPLLTASWSNGDKKQFNRYLQTAFDLLMFLSVPLALGGFVLSDRIMALLGGPEFEAAGGFLKIIVLAVVGVFGGAAFSHAVIAANIQKKTIWVYGVNALLAVIGYLLFIPRYGAWAAAVITAVNELLVPLLVTLVLWRTVRFTLNMKTFWKITLSGGVMALLIWPLAHAPLWQPVCAGIAIYTVGALALKVIERDTLKLLLQKKV